MELSSDNLLIITDLPACQISTQLSWLEVLRLLCVHLCSALSFDHNSPREWLQSPKQSGGMVLWIHVVTQQSTFIVATTLGSSSSSSSSHLRTQASGTHVSKRRVEWPSTSSRHVSVTQRGRKTVTAWKKWQHSQQYKWHKTRKQNGILQSGQHSKTSGLTCNILAVFCECFVLFW